jgi:hypothetical protein
MKPSWGSSQNKCASSAFGPLGRTRARTPRATFAQGFAIQDENAGIFVSIATGSRRSRSYRASYKLVHHAGILRRKMPAT